MNTKSSSEGRRVGRTAPTVLALLLASATMASAAHLTTQGKSGVNDDGDLGLEDINHEGDLNMFRNLFAAPKVEQETPQTIQ